MAKPEKKPEAVPIPKIGGGKERQPHEVRPSERQIPANRPAAPPKTENP